MEKLWLASKRQWLEERWLAKDLATRLSLSFRLKNDINRAALGEQWLGMTRGVSAFVFLSIGTGDGVVLVDALAYGPHSELVSLFANGNRSALMHS